MLSSPTDFHLPPHLRETCKLLAAGLVRLCCHTAEDVENARDRREILLHSVAYGSAHAKPRDKELA